MNDHTDCCPALALFVLGDVDRAWLAAQMCEWGRLQDLFDEEPAAGSLFEASR